MSKAFIWTLADRPNIPKTWGEMDFKNSVFETYLLLAHLEPGRDYGIARIRFRNWSFEHLSTWHCPPVMTTPVVSPALRAMLEHKIGLDEILFYPVSLICKNGTLDGYSFISPRRKVSCLDFEKSDLKIDHVTNGVADVFRWKRLVFKERCLGAMKVAWEAHLPGRIVVSEDLKNAIVEFCGPEVMFTLPEDHAWG